MKHLLRDDDAMTFFCDVCDHAEEFPNDPECLNRSLVDALHASIDHRCKEKQ